MCAVKVSHLLSHIVWSDGCSGQFKSSHAWYFISRYPNLTSGVSLNSGCQMCWNYFGSGHGKGEVDGAGALLKREIQKEQMKVDVRKLQNAAEIVAFLKEESRKAHAGPRGARCSTSKFFGRFQPLDLVRWTKQTLFRLKRCQAAWEITSAGQCPPETRR